jgi:hypothetical protein
LKLKDFTLSYLLFLVKVKGRQDFLLNFSGTCGSIACEQGSRAITNWHIGISRLLKNTHLLRYAHPSSLQRTTQYASFLRISCALHLDVFDQPEKNYFFNTLLERMGRQPCPCAHYTKIKIFLGKVLKRQGRFGVRGSGPGN